MITREVILQEFPTPSAEKQQTDLFLHFTGLRGMGEIVTENRLSSLEKCQNWFAGQDMSVTQSLSNSDHYVIQARKSTNRLRSELLEGVRVNEG